MADPWIPSHVNLGRHPKVRRAARLADCSVPQMVGHLHLLWHWALTIAPDGDLSRYEPDDLSDAAMWTGSPDVFVKALLDCGPGDSHGFLEPSFHLHDWGSYGGRYTKRSAAGKAAAAARWSSDGRASDQPKHANALRSQSVGNAEERRGEESSTSTLTTTEVVGASTPATVVEVEPTLTKLVARVTRLAAAADPTVDDVERVLPHRRRTMLAERGDEARARLARGDDPAEVEAWLADPMAGALPEAKPDPLARPALQPFTGHRGPGDDETIPDPLEAVRALRPTATEGAKA